MINLMHSRESVRRARAHASCVVLVLVFPDNSGPDGSENLAVISTVLYLCICMLYAHCIAPQATHHEIQAGLALPPPQ